MDGPCPAREGSSSGPRRPSRTNRKRRAIRYREHHTMYQLGHTRSAHKSDHLLHTPDTFVRAPLPGMRRATAIVHVGAAAGALFTQYTAEFEAGGELETTPLQRFLYVLEGTVSVDGD